MFLERLSLLAQEESGGGVSPIMWIALIAVLLLIVFLVKSFSPKGQSEGTPARTPQAAGSAATFSGKPGSQSHIQAPELTAEDVVLQRFTPTKFKEGYDQDEVDDFLDRVVQELRRLQEENDQLSCT